MYEKRRGLSPERRDGSTVYDVRNPLSLDACLAVKAGERGGVRVNKGHKTQDTRLKNKFEILSTKFETATRTD